MAERRELILSLLADDKTGPGTRGAAANLDRLAGAADDAATASDKLGHSSDRASQQAGDFGDSARDTAGDVERLQAEITQAERSLQDLAGQFARTNDAAQRMDLSKAMRRQETEIRRLSKVKDRLSLPSLNIDSAGISKQGTAVGTNLMGAIGGGMTASARAVVGPAGGVIAAGISPIIGTAVAGAIVGGAGLGGVIGGATIAAKHPAVVGAFSALGKRISGDLERAARPFVPQLLAGVEIFRRSWGSVSRDVTSLFANTASFVQPLARGVAGLVEGISGGVAKAAAGAGPLIAVLERQLPQIGESIGGMFEALADNGPEIALVFDSILDGVTNTIDAVGGMINGLTEAAGWIKKTLDPEGYEKYKAAQNTAKVATDGTARSMRAQAIAAGGQREALSELSRELRGQADPVFGLLNAQDALAEAHRGAAEATRKHGRNSQEAKTATRALAMAAIDLQGRVGDLGGSFNGTMTPALRGTLRAAGLTNRQINNLEQQFRDAKAAGDRFAVRYVADADVVGIESAIARVQRLQNNLTALTGRTNIRIGGAGRGGNLEFAEGGISTPLAMASGGTTRAAVYPASNPPLVKFAEPQTGGEAYIPKRGSKGRGQALVSEVASWYGMDAVPTGQSRARANAVPQVGRLEVVGEQQVVAFVRSLIRKYDMVPA